MAFEWIFGVAMLSSCISAHDLLADTLDGEPPRSRAPSILNNVPSERESFQNNVTSDPGLIGMCRVYLGHYPSGQRQIAGCLANAARHIDTLSQATLVFIYTRLATETPEINDGSISLSCLRGTASSSE